MAIAPAFAAAAQRVFQNRRARNPAKTKESSMNARVRNRIASAAALMLGLVTAPTAWAQPTGSVVGWGLNNFGQCDAPAPNSGFVNLAAGYNHSLGLKTNGSIVAWGQP
jgi:hypothetical protein